MEVRGEWDELGAVPVHQPLLPELLKLLHEHGSFGLNSSFRTGRTGGNPTRAG
jgi:hypothetical protein